MSTDLGFIHHFVPAPDVAGAPVLLLLHGTGGDENDLLDLGHTLLPNASLLSPRGKVSENGAPRFFRRLAEGVFDEKDLIARTHELADFVAAASTQYGFDAGKVLAVGYSNGANIAASTMLLRPEVLKGGVLLRAMVPLQRATAPDLTGVQVFLASGRFDPILPAENATRLAQMLTSAGAAVTHRWHEGGHGLAGAEIEDARNWLAGRF